MKHRLLIFAALAALTAAFSACNKQEAPASDNTEGESKEDNKYYVGTFRVGEDFSIPETRVDIVLSEDQKSADILLLKVRFAEQMPMSFDFRIPEVPVSVSNGKIIFEWNDTDKGITPIWLQGEGRETPYSAYQVTVVSGTAGPDDGGKETCDFSITFVGTDPGRPSTVEVNYQGSKN